MYYRTLEKHLDELRAQYAKQFTLWGASVGTNAEREHTYQKMMTAETLYFRHLDEYVRYMKSRAWVIDFDSE